MDITSMPANKAYMSQLCMTFLVSSHQSFNKYLLTSAAFSDGHCAGFCSDYNTGIGPDATGLTFELEETIFIICFLKVIENLNTKGRQKTSHKAYK